MMYLPKLRFPEGSFGRNYTCQNWHFPENLFSRIYTCQNLHLAKITLLRMLIFQNLHLSEITFGRNYISPKTYFPKFALAKIFRWCLRFVLRYFDSIWNSQKISATQALYVWSILVKRVARNLHWGGVLGVWSRCPQLPEAIGSLGQSV